MTLPYVEIDGRPADAENLLVPALTGGYGHFTALQVRDGRVRGLAHHLARLDEGTRELFGPALPGERVRSLVARALDAAGAPDASVRVHVYGPDDAPTVMVVVNEPGEMPSTAQSLLSVPYERPVAHLKHLGGFAQAYYGRLARRQGFSDALLTGHGGAVAEGAITNIAFWDGVSVVWPDRPALVGVTMAVLEPRLVAYGLKSVRREVTLAGLGTYSAAFVTNSRGIAPVGRIDEREFAVDAELMKVVWRAYEEAPWDVIHPG
ncbi:aminotransferase class IV [Streptomyces sp. NBC_00083]|uniref:aminotransferase class IV n=1 Tax=Streptomyces sp. NBC_00083 TaxID=2975647 RepID=UPI00224F4C16|nr:aminotransferase class IV [Streptomyces sp. NBC_00083]MCX5382623.1 aminotransferase class IV [Streptomyces sp. NBC_00083]